MNTALYIIAALNASFVLLIAIGEINTWRNSRRQP